MKKVVGYVTKQMYYSQSKKVLSPEYVPDGTPLKEYTIPLQTINSCDIERIVYWNEKTQKVELESLKHKSKRLQSLFMIEMEENKPILTIDMWEEFEKFEGPVHNRTGVDKKDSYVATNRRRDY